MGVTLRRLDLGMPQKALHLVQAAPRVDQEAGVRMPGVVDANTLGFDSFTTGDIPAVDAMFISMSKENRLILPRVKSEIRGWVTPNSSAASA